MSEKIFNVMDHGAVADGVTLDTAAVQSAVDACNAAGGGKVYFPKGKYVLATVFLKENVHIEFEKGTLILGALDFYAYAQQEEIDYPIYQDASHTYFDLSMFVGRGVDNISITGAAKIDMRSIWDEDGVRGEAIVHRGPKFIALKECNNVLISDLDINNVTDLAIYFAGCENVDIHGIKMYVYIDGISPDNCKNVNIYDCDLETGDDGIVFKSSYTLNRLDVCRNIHVWNCRVKSRCNAVKFGTETNGGFYDILVEDIDIRDTRISAIAIESVDGAIIDNLTIKNVEMTNVNAPIFIHIGKRMRGPEGLEVGQIKNVTLENINVDGPYEPYPVIAFNYYQFKNNDFYQYPWMFTVPPSDKDPELRITRRFADWQMTSNCCGLKERHLENITLRNIHLKLDGGVQEYNKEVPDKAPEYPEVYVYGKILPAKGIYFRYVDNLVLDNVTVETYRPDAREDFVFEHVN
ncbi:MAG: hypothetical protein IJC94_04180 [Oscillospiraceae bacterium]|nr:hypothetical protein [Oscillospiraceae bacterium]